MPPLYLSWQQKVKRGMHKDKRQKHFAAAKKRNLLVSL